MSNRYLRIVHTADWHLSKNVPRCRPESPEEWLKFQQKAVEWAFKQASDWKADQFFIVGDLFDGPKQSPEIINLFLRESNIYAVNAIKSNVRVLPGNHDILHRNLKNIDYSSIGILIHVSAYLDLLYPQYDENHDLYYFNYATLPSDSPLNSISLVHGLIVENPDFKFPNALTAQQIIKMFPDSKLILCGDNHKKFISNPSSEIKFPILIMPGPLFRRSLTEKDYKTGIHLIEIEYDSEGHYVKCDIEFREFEDKVELIEIKSNTNKDSLESEFVKVVKDRFLEGNDDLDFIYQLEQEGKNLDKNSLEYLSEVIDHIKEMQ